VTGHHRWQARVEIGRETARDRVRDLGGESARGGRAVLLPRVMVPSVL
jgi:hypothetical protein